MATIAKVLTNLETTYGDAAHLSTWTPMTFSGLDDGAAYEQPGYNDRAVQVFGTFGAAGSVTVEGSMDGTNYATLTDPQGNPLVFTTAKIEAVTELTRYIRPRVTAGDVTTSLTVILLARRNFT